MFAIENQALALGILLLLGYFGGELAKKIRIPAVAGYVLAGILLGPSLLNAIPDTLHDTLQPVKDLGAKLMVEHNISGLPVVDEAGRLAGRTLFNKKGSLKTWTTGSAWNPSCTAKKPLQRTMITVTLMTWESTWKRGWRRS